MIIVMICLQALICSSTVGGMNKKPKEKQKSLERRKSSSQIQSGEKYKKMHSSNPKQGRNFIVKDLIEDYKMKKRKIPTKQQTSSEPSSPKEIFAQPLTIIPLDTEIATSENNLTPVPKINTLEKNSSETKTKSRWSKFKQLFCCCLTFTKKDE